MEREKRLPQSILAQRRLVQGLRLRKIEGKGT